MLALHTLLVWTTLAASPEVVLLEFSSPRCSACLSMQPNIDRLVSDGAPVTAGAVAPGSVRVVVSRTRASVPGCPNWSVPAQPNYNNRLMSNFGCGVNSNLAAMVANPEDLLHGREGSGMGDAITSSKAVGYYWSAPPTGQEGLQDISTKKGGE